MTDIAVSAKAVASPAATRHHARRSPVRVITDAARTVGRSYINHLAAEQFIVPDGRFAAARTAA